MATNFRCTVRRNALVLVWMPAVLLGPLFSLPSGTVDVLLALALVAVMAGATSAAVLNSWPEVGLRSYVALAVLAAAVVTGSVFGPGWQPTWVLLAITVPAVLRRRWLVGALALTIAGAALASWRSGVSVTMIEIQAFVVSLSGSATASFLRLVETVQELQRTREELAEAAVAEERERFSRDLHDLLGHTLSVMVVKAQAVRRLAGHDPEGAAAHAADIETVGRHALTEVREAVDAMRSPALSDELAGARRALDAAGIRTSVEKCDTPLPDKADQVFAWVVREATTNVLRHSGASSCRIELRRDDSTLQLSMADDGVGGPPARSGRDGGLEGLRRRLVAAGGRLDTEPGSDGFRLTATMPEVPA